MKLIPTEEQLKTMKEGVKWFRKRNKPTFEISGGAGTGKTTLVKMITQELGLESDQIAFMAYVGKATLELTRKGTLARTIHSSIYDLVETNKLDENGQAILINGRTIKIPKFVLKPSLPPNIELIVVDEGAMVPENIAKDLLSYGIPIIVLGDMNQLPPVFGEPYFLREPDAVLKTPMRFALDSPIVYLANQVLNNKIIRPGKYTDTCYVIMKEDVSDNMLVKSDIVICGRNQTRQKINDKVRFDILKRKTTDPIIGDKIICRKNNWAIPPIDEDIYIINGLVGYVDRIHKESYDGQSIEIDFRPEFLDDDKFYNIKIDYRALTDWWEYTTPGCNRFEYAYAITCHLSQGSEYNNVLIYNERMGDYAFYKRWLYTAITRSKGGLILGL